MPGAFSHWGFDEVRVIRDLQFINPEAGRNRFLASYDRSCGCTAVSNSVQPANGWRWVQTRARVLRVLRVNSSVKFRRYKEICKLWPSSQIPLAYWSWRCRRLTALKPAIDNMFGATNVYPSCTIGVMACARKKTKMIERYSNDRSPEQQAGICRTLAERHGIQWLDESGEWREDALDGIEWSIGRCAEEVLNERVADGEQPFDYILSTGVLEHLASPEKVHEKLPSLPETRWQASPSHRSQGSRPVFAEPSGAQFPSRAGMCLLAHDRVNQWAQSNPSRRVPDDAGATAAIVRHPLPRNSDEPCCRRRAATAAIARRGGRRRIGNARRPSCASIVVASVTVFAI